ncbi:MAG: ribonuclease catalytic domain-containing protein [Thermodesulfobacteriota bacterium]
METGTIVEYIDQQRILCAIVLEDRNDRIRLLNENNREINQKQNRLSHVASDRLNSGQEREQIVESLKAIARKRKALSAHIDIREIWETLHDYEEWIDLASMTEFCFTGPPTNDQESAVVRAFFENRTYFKFHFDAFYPHSESVVAQNIHRQKVEARRQRLTEQGAAWLRAVLGNEKPPETENPETENIDEIIDILKSYYLFGKESDQAALGKAMLARAGADSPDEIFTAMVRVGQWDKHENLDLYRYQIPLSFSAPVMEKVAQIHADTAGADTAGIASRHKRTDLTHLPLFTIDGQGTMDFDDALSVETDDRYYRIGVHIADVGEYVEKGGVMDQEIMGRGTSIYMPDRKIPMLPTAMAENICSLIAGQTRPAISIMFRVTRQAEVIDWEIFASLISVRRQLSYTDVDFMIDSDPHLRVLNEIARNFRQKRLDAGAVQILLPEVSIRIFADGDVSLKTINRESPARVLVAEMMILANWLMARFLVNHNMPAVFRSQPEPRGRLYSGSDTGTLFQNWMQRRLLSRAVLAPTAGPHSGLGLDAYTTATSPIRKCFDLATQRQIRACLGLESPYDTAEMEWLLQALKEPLSHANLVQSRRNRYWVLKYLEDKIGTKTEAIVLDKRRDGHMILLPNYLLECKISVSGGMTLKPQDIVQVTIQHVDAARDKLSVFLG